MNISEGVFHRTAWALVQPTVHKDLLLLMELWSRSAEVSSLAYEIESRSFWACLAAHFLRDTALIAISFGRFLLALLLSLLLPSPAVGRNFVGRREVRLLLR
jgi:hypothetical protein